MKNNVDLVFGFDNVPKLLNIEPISSVLTPPKYNSNPHG